MSTETRPDLRHWRFTVDQYERMGRTGVFADDDRTELIDGQIVSMAPVGVTHASTVNRLTHLLVTALGQRAIVSVQNPIRLPPWSEPQPDLAILDARDDFYATGHPEPGQIPLVIEVAHSSLAIDRGVKLPLYARAGLPQVWIIDVEHRALHVHRDPVDGHYTDIITPRGGTIATGAPLDLEFYVAVILA